MSPSPVWGIIYNPTAGRFSPRRLEQVCLALETAGITPRLYPTARAGHARELAQNLAHGLARPGSPATEPVELVAAFGGDGTLNETANGLRGSPMPLAFLPGGTANVMAHELGLPTSPVAAVERLARGENRPIYPGLLTPLEPKGPPHLFLLMAGFGLDGAAVARVSPGLKRISGKGAYVASALGSLAGPLPRLCLEGWNQAPRNPVWVVAARGGHYGGRWKIHPHAGLEQPTLGFTAVTRRVFPFLAWNLGLGARRAAWGAGFGQGLSLTLTAEQPFHAQLDGEAIPPASGFRVALDSLPLWFRFPAPHPSGFLCP
ncbi:MAG: diacylglycerol kinase family protein [Deltaproteobacteria bacterium]|nr:diacylglycerol kinase family protein [Deltaproteobacteria bacterium]